MARSTRSSQAARRHDAKVRSGRGSRIASLSCGIDTSTTGRPSAGVDDVVHVAPETGTGRHGRDVVRADGDADGVDRLADLAQAVTELFESGKLVGEHVVAGGTRRGEDVESGAGIAPGGHQPRERQLGRDRAEAGRQAVAQPHDPAVDGGLVAADVSVESSVRMRLIRDRDAGLDVRECGQGRDR